MPSVITTTGSQRPGFGLGPDLVLAGSKASIFTSGSAVSSNKTRPTHLLTGFEKNEFDGELTIHQAGLHKRQELLGTKNESILGSSTTPSSALASLKQRFGRMRVKSSTGSGNNRPTIRIASSQGPPTLHYTNRQKHLLEIDGNQRAKPNQDLNAYLPSELPLVKDISNNRLGVTLLQKDHSSNIYLPRPKSSQVELSHLHGENDDAFGRVLVQRHLSDTKLSKAKESDYPGFGPAKIKIKSPENLNWNLQAPAPIEKKNTCDILNQSLDLRPTAPEPEESPSFVYSPRCQQNNQDSNEVLIANREYIDTVAKENQDFKNELNKSLSRLLTRAVKSAGPVTQEEVQNLKAQFETSESPQGNSPDPESLTPRSRENLEGKSYLDATSRRGSANSGDSGISSESVHRGKNVSNLDTTSVSQTSRRGSQKSKRSRVKQKSSMLADDPFNILKSRGKKSSKHKKRKSGKKSRQKSRQDSSSGKKIKIKDQNGAADSGSTNQNLLNFQAYCSPLQVLPASYKPKPEKPNVPVPQFSVKSHTASIYAKKLPRVPQPTITCDSVGLSGAKNQFDVNQSYPAQHQKRSLNLQATAVTNPTEGSLRKSLNESLRFHSSIGHGQHGEQPKITKVYLSEKQSGVLNELGLDLPCAPPVTPMPDILTRIEYIPSMCDIRAQRAVKSKLEILERQEIKRKEKLMAQQLKHDKISQKEREKNKKKQQRLQVYALNKLMTEFEHGNFSMFCKANGIECDL